MVNAQAREKITATPLPNDLRGHIRRALYAGAEAAWIYLLLLLVSGFVRFNQTLSLASLFVVYYGAMLIGRRLARVKRDWRQLQLIAFSGGFALILITLRIDLFSTNSLFDLMWLPQYFVSWLNLFGGFQPSHLATLFLFFALGRGLRVATRPLTMWFVGYQFRLTLVYVFFILIAASFNHHPDFGPGVFVFFAFWILTIALARVEEAGRERALGAKWYLTFVGAMACVLILAFGLSFLFQNGGLVLLGVILTPVLNLLVALVGLLLIPIAFIAVLVMGLLEPTLRQLLARLEDLRLSLGFNPSKLLGENTFKIDSVPLALPVGRTLLLIAVLALVAYWVVRQLNRRMTKYEADNFVVERASDWRASEKKKETHKSSLSHQAEIHAENIRRIYAAFLQRAAKANLARREAETPLEFLKRAAGEWQLASADLRAITNAYIAVHYAEYQANDAEVKRVRDAWERAKPLIQKPETKNKK